MSHLHYLLRDDSLLSAVRSLYVTAVNLMAAALNSLATVGNSPQKDSIATHLSLQLAHDHGVRQRRGVPDLATFRNVA